MFAGRKIKSPCFMPAGYNLSRFYIFYQVVYNIFMDNHLIFQDGIVVNGRIKFFSNIHKCSDVFFYVFTIRFKGGNEDADG